MISLTREEAHKFLINNGFKQDKENLELFHSPNSSMSLLLDWSGHVDHSLCRPVTTASNCIYLCSGESNVFSEKRFELSEEGIFGAICEIQSKEQE